MKNIPRVDLNDFLSNNQDQKNRFVADLGNAFENIGFVILKGHYLTAEHTAKLYSQIKQFFALPVSEKEAYEIPNLAGQRGYTSFGKESAKGKKEGDLKEFWHFGQYRKNENGPQYPENVYVEQLPEFNVIGKEIYQRLEKTGLSVLQAIALHLGLNEHYFDDYVNYGNSILRAIHYPPISKPPDRSERAAPHGDINLITLLIGAQGNGLQVLNRQKKWINAIAEPDEVMINIGDMLSRLTNNFLPSTIHRVINPPKEFWYNSRYSFPFFMHPIPEMPLNCLSQNISSSNPKKYEDITAGEFLNKRLIDLGLIKK